MLNEENINMSNIFIKSIHLENYKSILKADISLTNLNILIGANGAGKSNFISFFAFLQQMQKDNLRNYVLSKGGQDAFLYYGRKHSAYMEFSIGFSQYNLEYLDTLRVESGGGFFSRPGDSIIVSRGDSQTPGYHIYRNNILSNIQVYHFHDTSDSSPLKSIVNKDDNLFLRSDGANIAAMLKLVYDKHPEYYRLIVDTVRMVVPDFHDFVIRDTEFITLEWFNKNNVDIPWKAHYLSDGSLRFIALAILLLIPTELQPQTIIIDEPELGLHPSAINIFSGLIKRAANERQVIISTQSPALLANFEPQDIIVVDKKDKSSEFKRLNKEDLNTWLEDFSLPQLWDMNVIGGRP